MYAIRSYYVKQVPCIIIDISERSSALLALLENIQREDLSYFDEAVAIEQLIDLYGMTQEDRITSYNVCYTKLLRLLYI